MTKRHKARNVNQNVSQGIPVSKEPAGSFESEVAAVQNSLGGALGYGMPGFPQNQGSPWSTQLSQSTTIFKNLRWYLVSNFRQMLSEAYVELGLLQTVVDVPIDDALRGGVEIKSKQLEPEQIEELLTALDRDDDLTIAGQAGKWNRLFGGAGILILTDQDPEEPFDITAIGPDDKLEFRAVDMWELFWDKQNTEGYDPAIQTEDFEFYNYYGEQIHKSRVMRLTGITAPSFIRPRLRGWGFSVVEVMVRSVNQYLKATDLGFEVLDEFKLDVYKIKNLVNTLMGPNGEEKVRNRVNLANYQKNYQNAIVMDTEDDYDHKQLSFAGLAEAMAGIRMQVASDLRMPLTKLFGISAAGFNSGEDDIEVYNSMVESQVRNKLKYPILRICEIKCQMLFGMVPDDLSIAFKPLRVMSAEQEENVKTQKFNRLLQAKSAGEISVEEFRDGCNKDQLLGIQLEALAPGVTGYQDDTVGGDDDSVDKDIDNPGADRAATQKARATEVGGVPKGPEKPAPAAKNKPVANADDWDESKHPRADDGKFGKGGGSGKKKPNPTMKVTPEERKAAEKFVMSIKPGKVTKVTNPLEHKIAERLVAGGAAEVVGKKNYGRIEAITGTKEDPRDDTAPVTTTGKASKTSAITADTLDSSETSEKFKQIKAKSPKTAEAINSWGMAWYSSVRSVQQGKQNLSKEDTARGKQILKDMDEGWDSLPNYEGKIVRDISLDISEALGMFKEGETFETDAYSSFTAADRYLTRRKIRIQVEQSTKGKYVAGLCPDPEEKEVIIPKGVKYKITKVEERDEAPYVIVHVKEL